MRRLIIEKQIVSLLIILGLSNNHEVISTTSMIRKKRNRVNYNRRQLVQPLHEEFDRRNHDITFIEPDRRRRSLDFIEPSGRSEDYVSHPLPSQSKAITITADNYLATVTSLGPEKKDDSSDYVGVRTVGGPVPR